MSNRTSCGLTVLRQLNTIHKKGPLSLQSFLRVINSLLLRDLVLHEYIVYTSLY